jgi:hypothetical protein
MMEKFEISFEINDDCELKTKFNITPKQYDKLFAMISKKIDELFAQFSSGPALGDCDEKAQFAWVYFGNVGVELCQDTLTIIHTVEEDFSIESGGWITPLDFIKTHLLPFLKD